VGEGVAEGLRRELAAHTGRPDLALDGEVRPLDGGNSAALFAFEVASPPPGLEGPLVLRLPSGPAEAERAVHAAVTSAGYPAPTLRLDGDGCGGLGRPFLVMDRVEGRTPLDDAGVRGLPRVFRELPGVLAGLLADLHALPTAGLDGPELDATEVLLAGVPPGPDRDWLVAHRPAATPPVICHGDLHGFNLLARDGRVVAVLDWELAGLGPPELDVARTELILATLPGVSAVARRLLRGRSARVATAFTDAYRARAAVDEGAFRWFGALHAARLLAVANGTGAVATLWRPVRPALADRVRAAAG
jgi:aminoglycoside phosphotransferase (APT) family kinase protein